MDIGRVKQIVGRCMSDSITKDTVSLFLDDLNSKAMQGEKNRLIVRDVETMLHPGYWIDGAPELKQFRSLYKATKQKYFPRIKTRRQRINDILLGLTDRGVAINISELKHLLIELRDREENV